MKHKQFPVGRALIEAVKAEKCNLPKNIQAKLAHIQSLMALPKELTHG